MSQGRQFNNPYVRNLIYIAEIPDERHQGLLKIGKATLSHQGFIPQDHLPPNCDLLKQAANNRIDDWTKTAGIQANLLHAELAVRPIFDEHQNVIGHEEFSDHAVHALLKHSGVKNTRFHGAREWFETTLDFALHAIQAVKTNRCTLESVTHNIPYILRQEQEEAIRAATAHFKTHKKFLWNAKMRFGKTLTTLELIKREQIQKTIIITHRPVVRASWYEDFKKVFPKGDYLYGSREHYSLEALLSSKKPFIYFASIQDLRGSETTGGKFKKNELVFDQQWDLVIVDEAHEATKSPKGVPVLEKLSQHPQTKALYLSGTPFNLFDDFPAEAIFTWDYIMEREARKDWDLHHPYEANPYANLPKMNILTYDLKEVQLLKTFLASNYFFNFHEFFRTHDGVFVHEKDVNNFLHLLTQKNSESNYPYANDQFRALCRHSLWIVPGVEEAKALSKLMQDHPIFGSGGFKIVNVAGDGDENDNLPKEALEKVRTAIDQAGDDGYTITLSCGRLTTGVTVPEWTAVFLLAGGKSTSTSSYLQTIFRAQTPHTTKDGRTKQDCYVFEFAPDRTLRIIQDTIVEQATHSHKDGRERLKQFLEHCSVVHMPIYGSTFCPVIAMRQSKMTELDVSTFFQKLGEVHATEVVSNGFDDDRLYNMDALKGLDTRALQKFAHLRETIGASKPTKPIQAIEVNAQGVSSSEKKENTKPLSKPSLNEEEKQQKEKAKQEKKQAKALISVLRGVSIRLPLLVYGCDIPLQEENFFKNFVNHIDDVSWEEFLPRGLSKEDFLDLEDYYNTNNLLNACRKIQDMARTADAMPPLQRIQAITHLFSMFKNPDKETVLTPWKVVNQHMSDCLGGHCFFSEDFAKPIAKPRFVNQEEVTHKTIANTHAKILEINSKSGLYPLYVTYSIFKTKCQIISLEEAPDVELQTKLWDATIRENIFVLCRTPMAVKITKRTLVGFRNTPVNIRYFENLVETLKHTPETFVHQVSTPQFWGIDKDQHMKFDAIVGNPPYHEISDSEDYVVPVACPLYHYFVDGAKALNPRYLSMIMPAKWLSGEGRGLTTFTQSMLSDHRLTKLYDYEDATNFFPTVNIRGGVCFFLWDKHKQNNEFDFSFTPISQKPVFCKRKTTFNAETPFIRDLRYDTILDKVVSKTNNLQELFMNHIASSLTPFGLTTNTRPSGGGGGVEPSPCITMVALGPSLEKM